MNPTILLLLALFMAPLSGLGIDLYTPSLPAIAQQLHASAALAKLTITAYILGFIVGQILFGTLSEVWGRRYTVLLGIAVFCAASIGAAHALNIDVLLVCRALQGISAAATSVVSKTLLTDTFTGKRLAVATSYLLMVWSLGPIIGPVIGGYLQFYFNWAANFYFYALYTGILLLLAALFLKETRAATARISARDIIQGYKAILSHPRFLLCVLGLGTVYSIIIVFTTMAPFLIQSVLHYNALDYGHVALLVGAAYCVGSLANHALIHRTQENVRMKFSLLVKLCAAAVAVTCAYSLPLGVWVISAPAFVLVCATAFTYPIFLTQCMRLFPQLGGLANAVLGSTLSVVTLVMSLIMSVLKSTHLAPMAWLYFGMVVALWGLYWVLLGRKVEVVAVTAA